MEQIIERIEKALEVLMPWWIALVMIRVMEIVING